MTGFVKADSANLPELANIMILEYLSGSDKHNLAEIRGAKVLMASRDSYLESAVGYVEINRAVGENTVVRCKVTPEHRVTNKSYVVTITINERGKEIIDASCDGCAAGAGGCKHSIMFLYWLCKKSEQPASTSVECFWKRGRLTDTRTEPIRARDLHRTKKLKVASSDPNVLEKFKSECMGRSDCSSLITFLWKEKKPVTIFDIMIQFVSSETDHSFNNFYTFANMKINTDVINKINSDTVNQVHTKLWHSVRQGRLTASIIYDAAQCLTDGALVQQILGGYKVPETKAIRRGKRLEITVIKVVEQKLNRVIEKSGFILINGLIGASPDGLGDDFVLEVKCPMFERTIKNYVENGEIKNKVKAQMHLQMMAAKKNKALLCIADPQFERNKEIFLYWVDYDEEFINNILIKATNFWKQYIFNKVITSAKT